MSDPFAAADYSSQVQALLAAAPSPLAPSPLGPGTPNEEARDALEALTPESVVAPAAITDRHMAQACRAGLWLRHNYLDTSHECSQQIKTSTGSFWHGIMHRREADFSNAKYWFRNVGDHDVFPALNAAAQTLARASGPPGAELLATQTTWDPFLFVDLCQQAASTAGPLATLCQAIQQREWELLFDHSYRGATS